MNLSKGESLITSNVVKSNSFENLPKFYNDIITNVKY